MIELRPYQSKVIDAITSEAITHRRIILVAPCGAGKTVIASKIIQHASLSGKRVLFLAHRRELVAQASEKLMSMCVDNSILMATEPYDTTLPVCVSSLQTLYARGISRKKIEMPKADLVIFDEAQHLLTSNTWQKILAAYPDAYVLGLTATPINRSGGGMEHAFDVMVKCPTIQELTDQGFLVPARYFCPSIPDLAKIKIQAGDYNAGQLEERMDNPKLIGDILENWSRICPDKKTIVFASGVKHSIHIAEGFRSIGVKAEHIDGNTPSLERDEIVRRFKNGDVQVLSNCAVLNEGFDCPEASALVFARPTKSLLLYLQVAGRVLRPFQGKADCIIIDHAGVFYEHGPVAQDWDWQLTYGENKTVSGSMKAKTKKKRVDITCVKCKCVFQGRIDCPSCGERVKIGGKDVDSYEGYLLELDAQNAPKQVDKLSFYLMLRGYAAEKGKNENAAYYQFLRKFGTKPPWAWKSMQPLAPSLEVLSWIRHNNIAYAKTMKQKFRHTNPVADPGYIMPGSDSFT